MPLQATSGAASYDAFGGGVAAVPNYIEDVFSTWLYTGNGSTQTITNGIDLAGKGGLVWCKARSAANSNFLFDTARGANALFSNLTNGQQSEPQGITSFNANGFTLGTNGGTNGAGNTFVSWTFRKQPKFFDVVTFTTSGTTNTNQRISHSLGSAPGMIILKATGAASGWPVYHKDLNGGGTGAISAYLLLNDTAASGSYSNVFGTAVPTSTDFGINTNFFGTNTAYVAYVLAHNAGGFGLTGTDNVISCGSFTTDGSGNATVNLGWEPQFVIHKCVVGGTSNWQIEDSIRPFVASGTSTERLYANITFFGDTNGDTLTSTGFKTTAGAVNNSATYIYIAIRRGPMKVPTTGTSVFAPLVANNAGGTKNTTNFPIDLQLLRDGLTTTKSIYAVDRLRGVGTTNADFSTPYLQTAFTTAETSSSFTRGWDNTGFQTATPISGASNPYWNFRRAPGFFDEVCYTGTGSATTVSHNLGVAPELMIVKRRNTAQNWFVYSAALGNTKYLQLNTTDAQQTNATIWNSTTPTSSVFSLSSDTPNISGDTYIAYLFASCPGVSKCFSFTGNGTTQTINCGFTGGARFVLLKASSATGGWYAYDTARGMTTLIDPYLFLNSTAAEVATLGSVTTVTTGFAVNEAITTGVNTNGVTYVGIAIA